MQFLLSLLMSMTLNPLVDAECQLKQPLIPLLIRFSDKKEKVYDGVDIFSKFEMFSDEYRFFSSNSPNNSYYYLIYELKTTLDIFEELMEGITEERMEIPEYLKAFNYLLPIGGFSSYFPEQTKGYHPNNILIRKIEFTLLGKKHFLHLILDIFNIEIYSENSSIIVGNFKSNNFLQHYETQEQALYFKLEDLQRILLNFARDIKFNDVYVRLLCYFKGIDTKYLLHEVLSFFNFWEYETLYVILENDDDFEIYFSDIKKSISLLNFKNVKIKVG